MQKDSQTYSQRKIHREQCMKRKGWFKSWRVSTGEDSENEGDYTFGDMPWVWEFRAIYWTHKSWDLTQGRETPLDGGRAMWLTGCQWEARTPPPGACAQGLAPKPQWRGQIETTFVDACFPNKCPPLHMPCLLRSRTNNFTICMEIQKTSNNQSYLEKEECNWRNKPTWLQALLQSQFYQDSMVLAQRQKYWSMKQNRKPRDKSTHIWTPYLWQRRSEYTMD